eukprot:63050-Alexandrium_andersonii.AAC.1
MIRRQKHGARLAVIPSLSEEVALAPLSPTSHQAAARSSPLWPRRRARRPAKWPAGPVISAPATARSGRAASSGT